MSEEPILCNGNDLAGVLEDIRARGGVACQLDAGVGGRNDMYRVSYFRPAVVEPPAAHAPAQGATCSSAAVAGGEDSQPAPQMPRGALRMPVAPLLPPQPGNVPLREGVPPAEAVALGAATFPPPQAKIPAHDIALNAVKSAVAPRDPSNGREIPRQRPASAQRCATSHPQGSGGAETVGVENSIEDRLAALQAKLKARFQRSLEHVRLPHND
jgi:hypothetical protein